MSLMDCAGYYQMTVSLATGSAGLRCCEEKHGVDSVPAARARCSLAIASGDLGRYRQQMQLLKRALQVYETASWLDGCVDCSL